MRITFLSAVTCAIALLGARTAAANGRFPQSNQIVLSPTDPNLIVERSTYGIVISHDNGATWSFLCNDVLGLQSTSVQDPELGLTTNNVLLAGNAEEASGLSVSMDVGCNWACVGGALAGQAIVDLVVRPDAQHSALALTGTLLPNDAGVAQRYSQVFESPDDGATWAALGAPIDPSWSLQTIDVAKSDPKRIYVSGWRGYGSGRTVALFVSKDSGATWTENDVPSSLFDGTQEDQLWIGAVDPIDGQRSRETRASA